MVQQNRGKQLSEHDCDQFLNRPHAAFVAFVENASRKELLELLECGIHPVCYLETLSLGILRLYVMDHESAHMMEKKVLADNSMMKPPRPQK